MKKVCLITSEESFLTNFGAALQGYALYKLIKDNGYDVNILRYVGGQFREARENKISNWRKIKKYSFSEIYMKSLFRVGKQLHRKDVETQKQLFSKFQKDYMTFYHGSRVGWDKLLDNIPEADIYVCGSDQIWNPSFKNGYNDLGYFLAFVPEDKKKIAFAPSFGVDDLPETAQINLEKLLSTFDSISVRESAGAKIIKKYAKKDAKVVLDPTLLLKKDDWEEISRMPGGIPAKYILCYRFGNSIEVNKRICEIKENLNLPVITLPLSGISYFNKWEKRIFNAGPQEFIGLIKNATLVCTDSFHATVFSILMETPFVTFLRSNSVEKGEGMNSRVLDLLNKLGLNNRIYTENLENKTEKLLHMDFSDAKDKLELERMDSLMWLYGAMDEKLN